MVSGAAAVPTTASDEVDVCFARDFSETAPGELSERMRRLRTAVEKYTGRTLSSGGGGDGGSSPASPFELLDMAIASLLDASTPAPMKIFVLDVYLPSLIHKKLLHFKEPARSKFPYKTRFPETPAQRAALEFPDLQISRMLLDTGRTKP